MHNALQLSTKNLPPDVRLTLLVPLG